MATQHEEMQTKFALIPNKNVMVPDVLDWYTKDDVLMDGLDDREGSLAPIQELLGTRCKQVIMSTVYVENFLR